MNAVNGARIKDMLMKVRFGSKAIAVLALVFALVVLSGTTPAIALGADYAAGSVAQVPSEVQPVVIADGMYELRLAANPKRVLSVKKSSLKSGANVVVGKRRSLNNQKFCIHRVGKSYYRICSSLGQCSLSVKGSKKTAGANVQMNTYAGKASQLWRAEQLGDGSVRFVNKASGNVLAPKSTKAGANVCQALSVPFSDSKAYAQGFRLVKTKINLRDRVSYVNVAKLASSASKVVLSNKVRGYTVNKKKWKKLQAAVDACPFSLGFVMIDCSTGMTVSYNPNRTFFGASTIKGLYTTYLFEKELETGRLSKSRVSHLITPTIVWSNNGTYRSLRAGYGSSSRFSSWLDQVDLGYMGLWPSYSSRTLAKAWINMLAYSNSKGKHVGFWKKTFKHSDMSAIHDALEKKRTTYTKPGWMTGGTQYGYKLNDGGVVNDRHGRQYVLAILTSANPYGQKGKVQSVVQALDAIHMDMPKTR